MTLCRKEIEDTSKRKEDTATKPNRTFSIAPVELAEWEDRIYWGDIDAASAELLPEEEESCRRGLVPANRKASTGL